MENCLPPSGEEGIRMRSGRKVHNTKEWSNDFPRVYYMKVSEKNYKIAAIWWSILFFSTHYSFNAFRKGFVESLKHVFNYCFRGYREGIRIFCNFMLLSKTVGCGHFRYGILSGEVWYFQKCSPFLVFTYVIRRMFRLIFMFFRLIYSYSYI